MRACRASRGSNPQGDPGQGGGVVLRGWRLILRDKFPSIVTRPASAHSAIAQGGNGCAILSGVAQADLARLVEANRPSAGIPSDRGRGGRGTSDRRCMRHFAQCPSLGPICRFRSRRSSVSAIEDDCGIVRRHAVAGPDGGAEDSPAGFSARSRACSCERRRGEPGRDSPKSVRCSAFAQWSCSDE